MCVFTHVMLRMAWLLASRTRRLGMTVLINCHCIIQYVQLWHVARIRVLTCVRVCVVRVGVLQIHRLCAVLKSHVDKARALLIIMDGVWTTSNTPTRTRAAVH